MATTYYVSTAGNNANSGQSIGAAWRSIQFAVNQSLVKPGDEIRILPGRYSENISVGIQGAANSPITIRAHDPANPPSIAGPNYTNQMVIKNRSYLIIDGLMFKDYRGGGIWVGANEANVVGIVIKNCRFINQYTDRGASGFQHAILFDGDEPYAVSYSYIVDNYLEKIKTGVPDAYNETITMHHNVHHCLVEGNTINGTTYIGLNAIANDYRWGTGKPHHIIFRNNIIDYVEPSLYAKMGLYVDGGDHILYENNLVKRCDGAAPSAECWNAKGRFREFVHNILRNNVFDGTGGNSLLSCVFGADDVTTYLPSDASATQTWVDDSVFVHNVGLINNQSGGPFKWNKSRRSRVKNNVLAQYASQGMLSFVLRNTQAIDWISDGNLWYSTGNPRWSWPGGIYSGLAAYQKASSQEASSIFAEPRFVNQTKNDYRLLDGSPGAGQALPLTVTASNGDRSTALVVQDARYFCDGYGLIEGDRIIVDGVNAVVTDVNYSTNTLTLKDPISWGSGARVDYFYEGTAPSIGLTGTVSTGEPIIPPEPKPEPGWEPLPAIACEDNLVLNGVFADGGNGWQWFTAGSAIYRIVNGMARVSVSSSGRNTQLYQSGLSVVEGNQYSIAFAARSAQNPQKFTVTLHEHEAPYTGLGLFETVEVTAEGAIYSVQFVARQSSDNARLRFAFEETNEEIGIDNVCFSLVGEGPEPELPPYRIIETGARIGVLLGL